MLVLIAYSVYYISAAEFFKIFDDIYQLVPFPGGCYQMRMIVHPYPGVSGAPLLLMLAANSTGNLTASSIIPFGF